MQLVSNNLTGEESQEHSEMMEVYHKITWDTIGLGLGLLTVSTLSDIIKIFAPTIIEGAGAETWQKIFIGLAAIVGVIGYGKSSLSNLFSSNSNLAKSAFSFQTGAMFIIISKAHANVAMKLHTFYVLLSLYVMHGIAYVFF